MLSIYPFIAGFTGMNSAVCIVLSAFLFTYVSAADDIYSLAQRALNSTGLTPAQINDFVANVTAASSGQAQQTAINNYINSISDPTIRANVTAKMNEIEGIFNGLAQLTQQLLIVLAKYNISKDTVNQMAQDVRTTWQTTQNFTAVQQVLIADVNKAIGGGSVDLLRADIVAMFKQYNTDNPGVIQKLKNWFSNLFG